MDPTELAALRAAGNTPEVHAAAIIAAKDLLLSRTADMAGVPSDTAATAIAMHAAVIVRAYLELLGADGLVPSLTGEAG